MNSYVLIFDDGEEGKDFAEYLKVRKLPVKLASDDSEFEQLINEQSPDVIILDLMMVAPPGYNPESVAFGYITGAKVLERNQAKIENIPIILVSAVNPETKHYRAAIATLESIATLVARYQKPIDPMDLEKKISEVCRGIGH